jgi:hypothetical protein
LRCRGAISLFNLILPVLEYFKNDDSCLAIELPPKLKSPFRQFHQNGLLHSSLAELVMRPQAETQIGAAHLGLESRRLLVKG